MKTAWVVAAIGASLASVTEGQAAVSVAYSDPTGGWGYAFLGTTTGKSTDDNTFDALDGTWNNRAAGSDSYDGSPIGGTIGVGNAPGGVSALTEGSTNYIRIMDPGDPRDDPSLGLVDPTNRRIYFGHSITADPGVTTPKRIGEGVTLSFRARLATTGLLDTIHPDNPATSELSTTPPGSPFVPANAGYLGHDGGKGMFTFRQSEITDPNTQTPSPGAGTLSFSLVQATDTNSAGAPFGATGLVMNSLNTSTISGTVDPYQSEGTINVLAIPDVAVFHEFWITIQADQSGGGTHKVNIYMDGSTTAATFHVTGGTGNDYPAVYDPVDNIGLSYLGMGLGATPQIGAVDIDFYAYKEGVIVPTAAGGGPPGDLTGDNKVNGADFLKWQRDDRTTAALNAIKSNFGFGSGMVGVPEPGAVVLLVLGLAAVGSTVRRRRR
jgi:hypothetical protein